MLCLLLSCEVFYIYSAVLVSVTMRAGSAEYTLGGWPVGPVAVYRRLQSAV